MDAADHWCKCGRAGNRRRGPFLARREYECEPPPCQPVPPTKQVPQVMSRETREISLGTKSSCFVLGDSSNTENCEQCSLQASIATAGVVPLLQGVRATTCPSCADGDCINSVGERDVRVGRGALDSGLIAEVFISSAQCRQERRISWQLPSGAATKKLDSPLKLPFRAVSRRFHLIAYSSGNAFAQSGFKLAEFVLAFRADVDFQFCFVRDGIHGGAAFDLAQVERSARAGRHFGIDEAHGAANQRVDGVRHPKVRPAVTAR